MLPDCAGIDFSFHNFSVPVGSCPTEIVTMIRMMMMSTFIAHDSINLNAQCTKGVGGGGVGGGGAGG